MSALRKGQATTRSGASTWHAQSDVVLPSTSAWPEGSCGREGERHGRARSSADQVQTASRRRLSSDRRCRSGGTRWTGSRKLTSCGPTPGQTAHREEQDQSRPHRRSASIAGERYAIRMIEDELRDGLDDPPEAMAGRQVGRGTAIVPENREEIGRDRRAGDDRGPRSPRSTCPI